MAHCIEVRITLNHRDDIAAFGAAMAKRQRFVLEWLRQLHEAGPEAVEMLEDDLDGLLSCYELVRLAYPGNPDLFDGVVPSFAWYEAGEGLSLLGVGLDGFDLQHLMPAPPHDALAFLVIRPGKHPQLLLPEPDDHHWWPTDIREGYEPLPPAIRARLIELAG